MSGFIYAIECSGRVKLGYSEKPERRFSKIASDAPFPCQLLGYWPGDKADELDVQDKFNAIRSHGEWFAATEALLKFVAAHTVSAEERSSKRFLVRVDDSPLASWRKRKGLTQQELAALISRDASFVSRLESGASGASIGVAFRIVKITDGEVPVESLQRREAA